MRWLLMLALLAGCDDDPVTTADAGAWAPAFEPAGALLSTWGRNPNFVWAVGGQPELGEVWKKTDEGWGPVEIPEGPLLNWVHGEGNTTMFVGDGGRCLRTTGGAIKVVETGVTSTLWGVWIANSDQGWAVGGDARGAGDPDPVLLQWEGAEWIRRDLPALDVEIKALFKVWGTGPDNVWAVGQRGVLMHYDGSAWTQVPSGTNKDLISLWGTGPDDILAVGGRANGILARYDGTSWATQVLEGQPALNGIWMAPDGVATIVGARGFAASVPSGFEFERVVTDTRTLLHGVWGTEGYQVTVGGTLDGAPPWEGVALER